MRIIIPMSHLVCPVPAISLQPCRSAAERWVLPYCWHQRVLFLAPKVCCVPVMSKYVCCVPVLSKIPLQLLHLRATDRCPPPDWTLLVDLLMVVRTQAEWSNQHWRCTHIVYQFGKFRKFWFYATIYKSHFITFSCNHDHLQGQCKDIKLSSAILQTNFQRSCKENDQIK